MIEAKDLGKSAIVVASLTAATAVGVAIGIVVARDPQRLRDVLRMVAGGLERASLAIAEAREELTDLWADVREEARRDVENAAFATAATQPETEHGIPGSDASTPSTPPPAARAKTSAVPKRPRKPQKARAGAAKRRAAVATDG